VRLAIPDQVVTVEIKDVGIPQHMQRVMAQQVMPDAIIARRRSMRMSARESARPYCRCRSTSSARRQARQKRSPA
jgi:hypothetical protein